MIVKRFLQFLLMTVAAITLSLPAQAAMVGTAQMQSPAAAIVSGDAAQQREWLRQQLVEGGVEETLAQKRVAAMTDTQVASVHQRMDEMPAGASAEVIIIIALILVITEITGYTDIIPNWPAE